MQGMEQPAGRSAHNSCHAHGCVPHSCLLQYINSWAVSACTLTLLATPSLNPHRQLSLGQAPCLNASGLAPSDSPGLGQQPCLNTRCDRVPVRWQWWCRQCTRWASCRRCAATAPAWWGQSQSSGSLQQGGTWGRGTVRKQLGGVIVKAVAHCNKEARGGGALLGSSLVGS